MSNRSTEVVSVDGVDATYHAAEAGGDTFTPGEHTFLHVKNSDTASHDVTVVTPIEVARQPVGDVTVSVPAGGDRFAGPFPRRYFAGSDGLADITWSATTGMTFAVLRA